VAIGAPEIFELSFARTRPPWVHWFRRPFRSRSSRARTDCVAVPRDPLSLLKSPFLLRSHSRGAERNRGAWGGPAPPRSRGWPTRTDASAMVRALSNWICAAFTLIAEPALRWGGELRTFANIVATRGSAAVQLCTDVDTRVGRFLRRSATSRLPTFMSPWPGFNVPLLQLAQPVSTSWTT